MRKLNLANYPIDVPQADGSVKSEPFPVRTNLIELLFHPDLQLGAEEAMRRDTLAHKIVDAPQEQILLEEEDYQRILGTVKKVKGFTRYAVELLHRIYDAPEVDVKEA